MTTTQNTAHLMPAQQALLNESLSVVKDDLRRFLDDPNFEAKIGLAFGQLDAMGLYKMRSLIQNLSKLKGLPPIQILSADELEGIKGAFASKTDTIYLSESLFDQSNTIETSNVILEELGHYLDAQIHVEDSVGDEGAIFTSLVQGENLDFESLNALKIENDKSYIEVEGSRIEIEKAEEERFITISGKIKADVYGEEKELPHTKVGLVMPGVVSLIFDTTFTDEFGNYTFNIDMPGSIDEQDIVLRLYTDSSTFIFESGSGDPYTSDTEIYPKVSQDKIINPVFSGLEEYYALTIGQNFEEMVSAYDDFTGPIEKLRVRVGDTTEYIHSQNLLRIDSSGTHDEFLAAYSNRMQNFHQLQSFNVGSGRKQIETASAWEKGLDIYFAIAAQQVRESSPYENNTFYNDSVVRMDIEKHVHDISEGESSFRSIAAILYDIADGNKDIRSGSQDQVELNHIGLFHLLKSASSITRLNDFWQLLSDERKVTDYKITKNAEKARFGAIFQQAGVSPTLLGIQSADNDNKFDLNESAPTIIWSAKNGDRNDTFKVIVFNSDFSRVVFDSDNLVDVNKWTPEQLDWGKVTQSKGQYHVVVTGTDTTDLTTGAYWSGAETFYVGNIEEVKSAALDRVIEGTSQFTELLADAKDITQQLPNRSEFGLAFLGDNIFSGNTDGTAGIASFNSVSRKNANAAEVTITDDDVFSSIINIFNTISGNLQEIFPETDEDITSYHLRDAFHQILGDRGLGVLQDANNSGSIDFEDIEITSEGNLLSFQLPVGGTTRFDFELPLDLNLRQLGLELTTLEPTASLDLDYTLNLGLGIDLETQEFFIDTSSSEDVIFSLDPTLPELQAKLGFLNVDIVDNNSKFEFVLDLDDGANGDNILKLNEFSNLRINPTGTADINLDLLSKIDDNTPLFGSDLKLHWDFQENGATPTVQFENNTVYLGRFLNEAIAPNLDKLAPFLEPIKQVVDILDRDIDILSEFFDREIDLLALAEAANEFGQGHIEGAETVRQVFDALKFLNTLQGFASGGHGDGAINLGNVDLQNFDLRNITASTENAIVRGNNYTPNDSESVAKTLLEYQVTQRGLSLPILENPSTIAKLFLGNQAVDLFKYDLPQLDFNTSISAKFPILGPILAKLEGGIQASADLGFGFDSQGLIDWQNSGAERDFLNGFYIDDNREDSIDKPEAYIKGYLQASAGADAYIASAFVGGGLEANLEVDLKDDGEFGDFPGESDGKIRANEITSNPHCLLEAGGSLNANIFAEGKFLFWKKSKKWQKEIASFDLSCFEHQPAPILGDRLSGRSLHLNVGDRAHLRREGNTKDISESIQLQRGESNSVIVQGFGHEESFDNVVSITGKGGQGNDRLEAKQDATIQQVTFYGGEGDDLLRGGINKDYLYGGVGQDQLYGHRGNDLLRGWDDDDLIKGGQGNDTIFGGDGNDVIEGDKDNDLLYGGAGNDLFKGEYGDDTVDGGDDIDTVSYEAAPLLGGGVGIYLQHGYALEFRTQALYEGNYSYDTLSNIENAVGTNTHDIIFGNNGDNFIFGASGQDSLTGNAGADTLDGGSGKDFLDGGAGDDTYIIDQHADEVTETDNSVNGGVDTVEVHLNGAFSFRTLGFAQENLTLVNTGAPINSYGYGAGNEKDNVIQYRENGAQDAIQLFFYGNDGADQLIGDRLNDFLDGGDGDDHLEGKGDHDSLRGGAGNDRIDGGQGIDQAIYSNSISKVTVNLSRGNASDGFGGTDTLIDIEQVVGSRFDDAIIGSEENDTLEGLAGDDYLYGAQGNDLLRGGTGKDVLHGGFGDDRMEGGVGNDIYYLDTTNDVIVENAESGIDKVRTTLNNYTLGENLEELDLEGDAVIGFGNDLNNRLRGHDKTEHSETLEGGAGNDYIYGFDGNDSLSGDDGNDLLHGGSGADTIMGGEGDDSLKGNQGDDLVVGGDGNDSLYGDSGRDLLIGTQLGALNPSNQEIDVLTGGMEQDIFSLGHAFHAAVFYTSGANNDYARITDFSDDLIQIKGSFEDYDLRIGAGGPVGADDTGIYFTKDGANDLIAVVENVTALAQIHFSELGGL